ncbi:MAG: FAD:protein FMN transferase [Pedobacter sp.]|nr:MAG: FAD:protein FMN transferase [Pedobacter sp.]
MYRLSIILVATLLALTAFKLREHIPATDQSQNAFTRYEIKGFAQGTTYHIIYYATDSIITQAAIDSIVTRLDSSLSIYKPNSLVSQFNRSSSGIKPDIHLKNVVNKAIQTYQQTNGLFDITVYPLTIGWGFGPGGRKGQMTDSFITQSLPCVNTKLLYWKGNFLAKKKPCVQLDPNGIAQGYSVDIIANFIAKHRIINYLVELGGEIRIHGKKQPTKERLSIGIEAPGDDPEFSPLSLIVYPPEGGITTSGNYRRYYESNGKRISHLFDPRTGYPIQNELISVTLFAKDAFTSDAYDNALMAMGLQKAMKFVEARKDFAAHFIFRRVDGTIADTMTSRFKPFLNR